jgi:hypothetical protein
MLSGMLVMILLGIAEACSYLILKFSLWSAHTTAAAGIQGYRSTVLANACHHQTAVLCGGINNPMVAVLVHGMVRHLSRYGRSGYFITCERSQIEKTML